MAPLPLNHPAVVGIGLGGFGLYPAASWIGWAFGYMGLSFAIICVLSIVYFAPIVLLDQISAKSRG